MANDGLTGSPFTDAFPTPSTSAPNARVVNGLDLGPGSEKGAKWAVDVVEVFDMGPGDPGMNGPIANAFESSPTQRADK